MKRNIYKDLFILSFALVIAGIIIWGYLTFVKKEDKLSVQDRTIISDIVLGMRSDSLEMILENEKRLFSISDLSNPMSWSGIWSGDYRAQYTADMFNFSNWPTSDKHLGIFRTVTQNNRVAEVYLMLGNTKKNAKPGDPFHQIVSERILDAIEEQLINNYGPDSTMTENLEMYKTIDLHGPGFGEYYSGISKIKRFKAKFGHVDLIYGIATDMYTWDKVPDFKNSGSFEYIYFLNNDHIEGISAENRVWLLPCIHYVVDQKLYEELNLKIKL